MQNCTKIMWHIDSYVDYAKNIMEYLFLNSHKYSLSKYKKKPVFGGKEKYQ